MVPNLRSFGVQLKGIVVREGVQKGLPVTWVVVCKNHNGCLDYGDCGDYEDG